MTIESLLAEIKKRRLFVSNLYEGVDGSWRCFLRSKANDLHFYSAGTGNTTAESIESALHQGIETEKKQRIDRMLE